MTKDEAHAALLALAREGWVIGVEVFTGLDDDGNDIAFGLCDVLHLPHAVGSDCNRAEGWLMRPHDDLMTSELRAEFADNWDTFDRRSLR